MGSPFSRSGRVLIRLFVKVPTGKSRNLGGRLFIVHELKRNPEGSKNSSTTQVKRESCHGIRQRCSLRVKVAKKFVEFMRILVKSTVRYRERILTALLNIL